MTSIINATYWSTIQRFGALAIGFISNMVLARLLCPEDFGTVAMIMVFVGLADVLVDGGLGNALIQSKTLNKVDISTVFTTNLLISFSLFVIVFSSAPYFASYIQIDNFDLYLRVESVMILIRAFYVVHFSLANRNLEFKALAGINLTASFISTLVAIVMALLDFGIWSLIARNIILDLTTAILYYIHNRIYVNIAIDKTSFRRLFSYGVFVAVANLTETFYSNALSFIIGKKFSVKDLGYYNQAHSLEQIPVYSIASILNQVILPFMSKNQDNTNMIKGDLKRSSQCVTFIMYPMMCFLICYAKPIILLLYGEKWLPSVPFFQMLCIVGFFNAIYHMNRSVLKAIGKTKLLFNLQVLTAILGLLIVLSVMCFGVMSVVGAIVFNSFLFLVIVCYNSGKQIDYSVWCQIKDVSMNFLISVLLGLLFFKFSQDLHWNYIVLIVVMSILYSVAYLTIHYMLKTTSFALIKNVFENHICSRK